jgi:hypothetical protein
MTRQCPDDGLPELAHGRLPAEVARELAAHAASCAVCAEELKWLRAEAKMFADRAAAAPTPPDHVWKAIQQRTAASPPARQRRRRAIVAGATFAAAAAVALAVGVVWQGAERRTRSPEQVALAVDAGTVAMAGDAATLEVGLSHPARVSPGSVALDDADRQLDDAIAELTREYQRRRDSLPPSRARRYDAEFEAAREAVEEARRSAGPNVSARRQVVRARTHYLRSMQTVVLKEGDHAVR